MMKPLKGYPRILICIITLIALFCLPAGTSAMAKKPADSAWVPAPSNLTVTSVRPTSVSLSWSAPTGKKSGISYLIYQNGFLKDTVFTTSYTSTGLQPQTTYSFYIKAKDSSGALSAASNTVTAATLLDSSGSSSATASSQAPTSSVSTVTSLAASSQTSSSSSAVSSAVSSAASSIITSSEPVSSAITSSVTSSQPETPSGKIVAGYYASWSAYNGYTPLSVPASKLTHLQYAFAKIGDDLRITMGDPAVDPSNFTKLAELKKANPHLKASISIGGWNWSGKFSDAALTDASRTVFADSVVGFVVQYGFDGVDLDWEYPVGGGLASNSKRPEDKTNFTLLLQKLRQKLDAREALDGKHYLLSIAGGAGGSYVSNTELKALSVYLDYATIMTYDMHGSWDQYADFNAPLYTPKEISPQYKISVDEAVKGWLAAGFPASKLVLGMPFYGYLYNGVSGSNNGLYSLFTSANSISYDRIAATYLTGSTFSRYVHPDARVPWLYGASTFISYDDADSLRAKAQYAQQNLLAGACVWELSQNKSCVLLDAITAGLQ